MKICSKCAIEKPETDFFIKDKKAGRLHAQCKSCYREHRQTFYVEHYEKYKNLYRERAKIRRNMLRNEFKDNMLTYLKGKSCAICGEEDIRTFEFDHIDPASKLFGISQAVRLGYRWPQVLEEINKCQILCANCHKKRTAMQYDWFKN